MRMWMGIPSSGRWMRYRSNGIEYSLHVALASGNGCRRMRRRWRSKLKSNCVKIAISCWFNTFSPHPSPLALTSASDDIWPRFDATTNVSAGKWQCTSRCNAVPSMQCVCTGVWEGDHLSKSISQFYITVFFYFSAHPTRTFAITTLWLPLHSKREINATLETLEKVLTVKERRRLEEILKRGESLRTRRWNYIYEVYVCIYTHYIERVGSGNSSTFKCSHFASRWTWIFATLPRFGKLLLLPLLLCNKYLITNKCATFTAFRALTMQFPLGTVNQLDSFTIYWMRECLMKFLEGIWKVWAEKFGGGW